MTVDSFVGKASVDVGVRVASVGVDASREEHDGLFIVSLAELLGSFVIVLHQSNIEIKVKSNIDI